MGSLSAGLCFDSVSDATNNYWSHASISPGSPLNYIHYSGSGWVNCSDAVCMSVPSVSFPVCDVSGPAVDGLLLGSGVVGVWVTVWAIMAIKRAL